MTSQSQQHGFTIIELLIATSVFAVVLLLCTFGLLQIGRTYYKGITVTNTQNAARSVIDQISQAIQFSGDTVEPTLSAAAGSISSFCINQKQYTYVLGKQLTDKSTPGANQSNHVLTVHDNPSCFAAPGSASFTSDATELLSPNMRLAAFSVQDYDPVNRLYNVTVRVVYGDDDLLCSPSVSGSCSSTDTMDSPDFARDDLTCKLQIGSQFCAVSDLSTTVQKRVQ